MSLEALAERYRLDLPIAASNVGWMLMPRLPMPTIQQIARITRMLAADIEAIQTPADWLSIRDELFVCPACLFMNPQDVCSPYWMRDWLAPDPPACSVHREPAHWVATSLLGSCRNFADVLQLVSHYDAYRRGEYWSVPSRVRQQCGRPRVRARSPTLTGSIDTKIDINAKH